jgi:phosphohistidine phosphatase SixA
MVPMFARLIALCGFIALLPVSASAQAQPEWVAALRSGGHVIVFRHGATHTDQADTDPLNLDNVAKQRQLNDEGRAKHKQIGDAFRKLNIKVASVQTSKIYRAIETGKLMFPELEPQATMDLVEVGQVSTPIENNRRIAALRKLAATVPPAGSNVVIVTHRPNVLDAFGKDWFDVREAEASIFKPDGTTHKFVARVLADDWAKAAQ